MFEQSLMELAAQRKKNPAAWLASTGIQVAGVVVLILIPLATTEAVPRLAAFTTLVMPRGADPKPADPRPQPRRDRPRDPEEHLLLAPTAIPPHIDIGDEPRQPLEPGFRVLPESMGPSGGPNHWLTDLASKAPVRPPDPPKPAPDRPKAIRVSGLVQEARVLHRPLPVYPNLARIAGIHGAVRLEAVISRQGKVDSLRVVAGHPLLVEAALQAVRQWRYRPTMLGDEAVEVLTTIEVNFTLNR